MWCTHGHNVTTRAFMVSSRCRSLLFMDGVTEDRSSRVHPARLTRRFFPTVNTAAVSHRTNGDVLFPLAHVGALLQRGAPPLLEVPAAVGVPRLQAQSGHKTNTTKNTNKQIKGAIGNRMNIWRMTTQHGTVNKPGFNQIYQNKNLNRKNKQKSQ